MRKCLYVLGLVLVLSFVGSAHAQSAHGITLSWSEAQNSDLAVGFNVFRAATTGGPYTQLNTSNVSLASPTYFDTTVAGGKTYYYVVTAVDALGIQSANSTEVSITAIATSPAVPVNVTAVAK